jgi:hypothetical protein
MENSWKRDTNVIAERFKKDSLPGFLRKEFLVKDDEGVVVERKGEIYLEKGPGKFSVSSLMKDFTDVVFFDKAEKTLEKTLNNVCLRDREDAILKLSLKFRILNSDHFSKNLMGEREKMLIEDVWNEIFSNILCKKVLPQFEKKKAEEILSSQEKNVKDFIEKEIKKKFKDWGLMLTSFSASLHFEDVKVAEEIKADEDEIEELQKERLKKDVEMLIEKKEMQRDMEDALEALKLKEIMEKEKEASEIEKLEDELETLKKAKEVAERKFYKKELSEASFQRIMEDLERKIIEIETKIKRKSDAKSKTQN